jgi:hypothetical protein
LRDYAFDIKDLDDRQKAIQKELRAITDPTRADRILAFYRQKMADNLEAVNVETVRPKDYHEIASRVWDTGSEGARALMAYYYAVLQTMAEFSSAPFFPIVIDSPNQQAQDSKNLPLLLKFVVEGRPSGAQLILAVEEPLPIYHGGSEFRLGQRLSAMREDAFAGVADDLRPLLDKLLLSEAN